MSHQPSTARNFGVQSYCFRNFTDTAEVAAKVHAIGLNQIELCAIHADFSDPHAFAKVAATYREHGVEVISIGVQTFTGQDEEERWFESVRAAGASHLSCHFQVDSYLKALPKVRHWARKHRVRVAIHTHGGYLFGGSPDVMDHLLALGGPEIGLCLDTAWAMQIGPSRGNPVEWVKRYGPLVYGIHFKDFVFEKDGQWRDVVVGTGNLALAPLVEALDEVGFDGYAVLEYEGDPEDPVPALRACVEKMRAIVGSK